MKWAAPVLLVAALAALAGALYWDSSSPDFWETGPILGSVGIVSVLLALSVYAWRRSVGWAIGALVLGAVVAFIALGFVALTWQT